MKKICKEKEMLKNNPIKKVGYKKKHCPFKKASNFFYNNKTNMYLSKLYFIYIYIYRHKCMI